MRRGATSQGASVVVLVSGSAASYTDERLGHLSTGRLPAPARLPRRRMTPDFWGMVPPSAYHAAHHFDRGKDPSLARAVDRPREE